MSDERCYKCKFSCILCDNNGDEGCDYKTRDNHKCYLERNFCLNCKGGSNFEEVKK